MTTVRMPIQEQPCTGKIVSYAILAIKGVYVEASVNAFSGLTFLRDDPPIRHTCHNYGSCREFLWEANLFPTFFYESICHRIQHTKNLDFKVRFE